MGNVFEGKFGRQEGPEIDETKRYVCYFCEETVVFAPPFGHSRDIPERNEENESRCAWRHVASGLIPCICVATPSNLEITA
jgi:hypothetical protein